MLIHSQQKGDKCYEKSPSQIKIKIYAKSPREKAVLRFLSVYGLIWKWKLVYNNA